MNFQHRVRIEKLKLTYFFINSQPVESPVMNKESREVPGGPRRGRAKVAVGFSPRLAERRSQCRVATLEKSRALARRYATQMPFGVGSRGLKPTATVAPSLRDFVRGVPKVLSLAFGLKRPEPAAFKTGVAAAIVIMSLASRLTAAPGIDPDADRIFKACCKYLADAKAFTVKVEVWKDIEIPAGPKVQTTTMLELQEQRPDKLHIEARSPKTKRGFWYEKKSLTMLDRELNVYATMEVPDHIDKAIDAVEDQFGIEIPLGDVLVADPYRNTMDAMETLADLGKATVLGVPCNHLLFTGPAVDAQVWIADGAKPLPRKIVLNFKSSGGPSQITQIFSDWDQVSPVAESVFTFIAPDGANKISVCPKKTEDSGEAGASKQESPVEPEKK
ncbi:MAG: hypothetical protein C5B50_19295 [Verrucomicrobia bacterium]|nr:MAG: hypothetical protein C5B50_19295 [Verrucomicrobiota bacterium]